MEELAELQSVIVSIPEKREIPFEEVFMDKKVCLSVKVSIPEKREIPFEGNIRLN